MAGTEKLSEQDTGDTSVPCRTIVVPFDRYEIVIRLGPGNEFMGIAEVKVSKDFLTFQQKTQSHGYHDVEDLYEE